MFEIICSKLSRKDGGGCVSSYSWTEENRAGGAINGLKYFITASTIPCKSYSDNDELGAKAETAAGGSWLDPL